MLLEDQVRKIAEDHLKKMNRWPMPYDLKKIEPDEGLKQKRDLQLKTLRKTFLGDKFDESPLPEEWCHIMQPADFEPYYHISYSYSTPAGNKCGFFSIDAKTGKVTDNGNKAFY